MCQIIGPLLYWYWNFGEHLSMLLLPVLCVSIIGFLHTSLKSERKYLKLFINIG